MWIRRRTNERHRRVFLEQLQIGVQLMRRRHRIQNEIKLVGIFRHLIRVRRNAYFVGAQALGIGHFAGRCGKQHHVRAHGVGNLHTHVPQATKADDADLFAGTGPPMLEGRIGRNTGAEQRRHSGELGSIVRDMQHKRLFHHDALRIAPVRVLTAEDRAIVGTGKSGLTVLLLAVAAGGAMTAAIDHATHPRQIANLELPDLITNRGHAPDDLMTRHRRIERVLPFIAGRMQIRVADATVKNLDLHIIRTRTTAFDLERRQRTGCGLSAIGFYFGHVVLTYR